jgi:hypothetical protein
VSDDPDSFAGLTRSEALRLCVRHANDLSLEEVDFIQRLNRAKPQRPMGAEDVVRLRALVTRLQEAVPW